MSPSSPAAFNRRPELTTAYTAPTTELEHLVARHWAYTLGLDRVGIHDNFFDLGGESLLVIQMADRLRDELAVDLSVKKLFDNLTVAEVVREIEYLQQAPASARAKISPSRRRATHHQMEHHDVIKPVGPDRQPPIPSPSPRTTSRPTWSACPTCSDGRVRSTKWLTTAIARAAARQEPPPK